MSRSRCSWTVNFPKKSSEISRKKHKFVLSEVQFCGWDLYGPIEVSTRFFENLILLVKNYAEISRMLQWTGSRSRQSPWAGSPLLFGWQWACPCTPLQHSRLDPDFHRLDSSIPSDIDAVLEEQSRRYDRKISRPRWSKMPQAIRTQPDGA
jgi:hypothetical protein